LVSGLEDLADEVLGKMIVYSSRGPGPRIPNVERSVPSDRRAVLLDDADGKPGAFDVCSACTKSGGQLFHFTDSPRAAEPATTSSISSTPTARFFMTSTLRFS